ncbi:hypothetical protein MPH_00546 [Macrophomina phaseolina MS6]|uniref:Uncharacterized protein n=1 Tax=Macrophomina phaseolina (strain MS6) TaxID=1126212 RepID=K2RHQ3_MACPH|nr:hypothetical protein MPH_00546 [Macrophomina phaseolina MS6]
MILTGTLFACLAPTVGFLIALDYFGNRTDIENETDVNKAICRPQRQAASAVNLNKFSAVTFSTGTLTWAEAKAIEVAWNFVVGKSIQAILVLSSYWVFMGALVRNAERTPIPYSVYSTLAFQHGSPASLWYLLKNFRKMGGARLKATLLWLVFSIIFILVSPSILDLMAGYISKKQALVKLSNGVLLPWKNATYITNEQTFHVSDPFFYKNVPNANGTFHLLNDTFEATDLFAAGGTSPVPHFGTARLQVKGGPFECVPTYENTYEWGLAPGILLVWIPLMLIWTAGMYLVWFDTHRNSKLWRRGRRLGMWRAVLDLAEAIREDLGPDLAGYSNEELDKAIDEKGSSWMYYASGPATGRPVSHIGLTSRQSGKLGLSDDAEQLYG